MSYKIKKCYLFRKILHLVELWGFIARLFILYKHIHLWHILGIRYTAISYNDFLFVILVLKTDFTWGVLYVKKTCAMQIKA